MAWNQSNSSSNAAKESAARITTGAIEAGRPLPSQRTLIEEYGLARGTVARAFRILSDEGLVVTVPGKGIFVKPEK